MCSDHESSSDGKADRTGVPWIIEQTGSGGISGIQSRSSRDCGRAGAISGHHLQLTYQSTLPIDGQAAFIISPDSKN